MTAKTVVETSKLEGLALNWAVAQVVDYKTALEENDHGPDEWIVIGREDMYLTRDPDKFCVWSPSTDWSQGGPLRDKYRVEVLECGDVVHAKLAGLTNSAGDGGTALIAICRAIVASEFGDIVKVPACLVMP